MGARGVRHIFTASPAGLEEAGGCSRISRGLPGPLLRANRIVGSVECIDRLDVAELGDPGVAIRQVAPRASQWATRERHDGVASRPNRR